MNSSEEPYYDPELAERGKSIAIACTVLIVGMAVLMFFMRSDPEGSSIVPHLIRLTLVVLLGIGTVRGVSIAMYLLAIYSSLAGTYICILSLTADIFMMDPPGPIISIAGGIGFFSAVVLTLSSSAAEHCKRFRYRHVGTIDRSPANRFEDTTNPEKQTGESPDKQETDS